MAGKGNAALAQVHGFNNSPARWRTTPRGVEVNGKFERTVGQPISVTNVWKAFHAPINAAATKFGVPVPLIIATICTESQPIGDPRSLRLEPGFISDEKTPHKVSPGLMQTLISTARGALKNPKVDRAFLFNPANSILAGTAVMKLDFPQTGYDPPLVAAKYNAGSLIANNGPQNRWRLRMFPIGTSKHVDRFIAFFNDACFMLATHPIRPTVGLDAIIGQIALSEQQRALTTAKNAAKVLAAKQAAQPAAVNIAFGQNAKTAAFTPFSRKVLSEIMRKAGVPGALITSTQRSPQDQARAMFQNLEAKGVASQKALYGPNGDLVIDVFAAGKAAGKTAAQIQADMTKKIIGLGPSNVSHHAADPKVLNVFDVAPTSIPAARQAAFKAALRADPRVKKFLEPSDGDPAFHIEIAQPG